MWDSGIFLDNKSGAQLNYYKLVRAYLEGKHVTIRQDIYYSYNSNLGIWESTTLDELTTQIAVYCNKLKADSWEIEHRSSVAETLKVLVAEQEQNFHSTEYTLCLSNGIFNLLTGELIPHSPDYFFTSNLGYEYNETMKCPYFSKFMNEICQHDRNRKRALLEFLGYSLTFETRNHKLAFFYGEGANGKSTLLEILSMLVGKEHYLSLEVKELKDKFAKASIQGKKVVAFPDISKEEAKAGITAEVKKLVSGDEISADRKYLSRINFKPQAKLIFLSNHQLSLLNDCTDGAKRRISIFPFLNKVEENQMDLFLLDKMKEELPAILRHARKGYLRLKKNNYRFSNHEESKQILRTILIQDDPEPYFVQDKIKRKNSAFLSNGELKKAFAQWADDNKLDATGVNIKNLSFQLMKIHNAKRGKSTNGIRGWRNVTLKKKVTKTSSSKSSQSTE